MNRLLIVDDDRALTAALRTVLASRADQVLAAHSQREARALLEPPPDLVLLDYALPDGHSDDLVDELIALRPVPMVIAMSGQADSFQAFCLARRGVVAYLAKPFDIEQLSAAWDAAVNAPPQIDTWARTSVGKMPLHAMERRLRASMVDEALARSKGSRRFAARLLGVSRQLLQHMIRP